MAPADRKEETKTPSDEIDVENVHLMQRNVHAIETLSSVQLRTGQAQEESVDFFESQALRLFNNPEHFHNFRNSHTTETLRRIPFDELEATVDQAIRVITPDMDESYRGGIVETLEMTPPEGRASLIDQALRLITPEMDGNLRYRIIYALRTSTQPDTLQQKLPSFVDLSLRVIAHQMNANERFQIIRTLADIPSAEREPVVDHALRLINDQMNDRHRKNILFCILETPSGERQSIVDEALRLVTNQMDGDMISYILSQIFLFRPEERQSVVNQALRLITDLTPPEGRGPILRALMSIRPAEREAVVDQALRMMTGGMPGIVISNILNRLKNMPEAEREALVDQALRLITDMTTPPEREIILSALRQIQSAELEAVVDQALRLITDQTEPSARRDILALLRFLPPAEREAVVNQTLRLITDQTDPASRWDFLNRVATIPAPEREALVDQAHRLITQQMPEWGRGLIFGRLATIPAPEREAVVDQALRLITVETTPAEREYIVNSIRLIPFAHRETVVNQVHRLITEQMSGGIRGNIIERLRNVPPDEREGAVTIALRFINNQTSPQERLQILERVIDTPHHLRETMANPTQPGPVAQAPLEHFLLSLNDIYQQPETVLHAYASESERAIPHIQYVGSVGIDAGGVTRDFITRLFHSLYPEDPLHARLGSKPDSQQLRVPMTDPAFSDIGLFRDMGVIFGEILSGRLQAPIGNRFSPLLFELLHAFTANDLNSIINPKADPQTYSKLLEIYVKAQFPFMTDLDIAELEAGRLPACLATDDIRTVEQFFEETGIPQVIMAAVSIAKGISSRVSWDHQKRATPAALMEAIQGSLSSQRILNSLTWMNQNGDQQGFLTRWIREADSELLKKFLFCISGSETLGQRPLNIFSYNPANPQTIPAFHTCSLQMDLPRYRSYELFKDKLEYSLAHAAANPASGVSSEEERKGNESFQLR